MQHVRFLQIELGSVPTIRVGIVVPEYEKSQAPVASDFSEAVQEYLNEEDYNTSD
jgi:hypothetical protein